jgi:multidrug efflux pump subunit AcrA (membrane-fusion protein)
VTARQELEEAQIAVRVAADDLAAARRASEAAAVLAAAQSLQAQTQAEQAIADERRQRDAYARELTEVRGRQLDAERALASAIARVGDRAVRATGDARVAEVAVKPGDRVVAGAPLLKLAVVNPMVVDVRVPPSIVNGIARGDAAIVRVGSASTAYAGRIKTIAPLPDEGGSHTVEVEFDNPAAALLAGQTAHVRLSPRGKS